MRIPSPRASLVYLHDLTMTAVSLVVALYLRVGQQAFDEYRDPLLTGLPILVLIGAVAFRFSGLYRGIWRYASVPDLAQLLRAVTMVVLCFVAVMFLLTRLESLPRSLPVILWFVQLVLLGGPRFAYRLVKDRRLGLHDREAGGVPRIPVLLLGVSDAAELFIRSLDQNAGAAYRAVGLLDDKNRRIGHAIRGVPVLGGPDDLPRVVEELAQRGDRPQRLIVAKGQADVPGTVLRDLLEQAELLGLSMARLPSLTEFKSALGEGKIEVRPIALEDLLGRPQAVLNRGAIASLVTGRRVVVTGAGGTIGSELVRQIAALEPETLTLVDAGEFNLYTIEMEMRERFPALALQAVIADVRDRDRIFRLFQTQRPHMVFHAAALKHVPLVEANPAEGALTNVIGTRNVADAARANGCQAMVLVSTDKAIRPTSVMGATKRFAECYCQALDMLPPRDGSETATRYMTVRFGNVLGSSGSVVPLFTRQLAKGGPLTVTHPDMRRYFMTVREAVELVLQASAHGVARAEERGKVLVLDMGEPVKIVDLARQMIRLAGYRPGEDIRIEFTGLRPGEKLFEEILTSAEAPSRTEADGVFLASPRVIDYALINRALGELETAARAGDAERVMTILTNIVPDFRAEAVLPPPSAFSNASGEGGAD
ncbi:nucleotide sugar dehydratase [Azospirillum argentinense]|uniref:Nucleotide sugar dehydratase n=2 Tax=Azospirillum TaxID=191 RepID=A0A2K1G6Z0_9PROT|nr:nucleoside-diphosphate sugar epimerase/dehydratase [Azospirillum argentinense]AIB11344.1 nucleotide sugar dehydratase [Azospirillum argentinense]EZQ08276.1 nucleotide sugar dehydratase [Azospirillum argentinense]MBK3799814.1 NAD-dependent epimerase/dehydratase family protein [Azospirillum argentinense]PNR00557.1 polysaccharide biosynthesis protein [Azospirillum argentinense]QCO01748.1 polysaccharide biosynthesis protein [Azospirillum argentinense]